MKCLFIRTTNVQLWPCLQPSQTFMQLSSSALLLEKTANQINFYWITGKDK